MLQFSVCVGVSPSHVALSSLPAVHAFTRERVPPPQVTVQAPHCPHSPHVGDAAKHGKK